MPADKPVAAIALIAAERQRQIDAEHWTPEHDDEHDLGELATAAACYALPVLVEESWWPWLPEFWKPTDDSDGEQIGPGRIRELVKAGALIVAEIERLQREEARRNG